MSAQDNFGHTLRPLKMFVILWIEVLSSKKEDTTPNRNGYVTARLRLPVCPEK